MLGKRWNVLRHIPDDALEATLANMQIAAGTDYTVDDLVRAVRDWKRHEAASAEPVPLRRGEHEALMRGRAEVSPQQQFVCVVAEVPAQWASRIHAVRVATRLREVRVLESFTRVLPPSPADPPERHAPLYSAKPNWLPAIEVTGEGVFIELDRASLQTWEGRSEVLGRARLIDRRYAQKFADSNRQPDRPITPRVLLLHTLAHALIQQWSLDSGYPAASLRERLYAGPEMAGLLIYTATSDSAGSLGGIAAQGQPAKLGPSLIECLERAAWCSSDPLCAEAVAQGTDGLNLAACHACLLLPEVSCEEMNVLLDRTLLVGLPSNPDLGFFALPTPP